MRSFLSAIVLAASFALLVPDNRGQAVNAAEAFRTLPISVAGQSVGPVPAISEPSTESNPAPVPDAGWLLAIGFLAAVMARRLRAD
jgi:hypothetical protein